MIKIIIVFVIALVLTVVLTAAIIYFLNPPLWLCHIIGFVVGFLGGSATYWVMKS